MNGNGDPDGTEYATADVEYFGAPRPSQDACRSLGEALGVSAEEARSLLETGGAAAAIETRQSWNCTACGGGLMHPRQLCRSGRAKPGESKRAKPMPWDCLDGADAAAITRRRFVVPL